MTRRKERNSKKEKALAADLYARRNDPEEWEETPVEAEVQSQRAVVTSLRLPLTEFTALQRASKASGKTVSEFIRAAIASKLRGNLVLNAVQIATGSADTRSQATVLAPTLKSGETENLGPDYTEAIPLYANLLPV